MSGEHDDLPDEEHGTIRASPWAIEAGLLVEVDGQVLVTPKGLAVMRNELEKEGLIPKRH